LPSLNAAPQLSHIPFDLPPLCAADQLSHSFKIIIQSFFDQQTHYFSHCVEIGWCLSKTSKTGNERKQLRDQATFFDSAEAATMSSCDRHRRNGYRH